MKDALGSNPTTAVKLNEKLQRRAEIVKTLARGGDKSLTLYKLMPMDIRSTPNIKKSSNKMLRRKEPRDKYSIEYLWNIGAVCDF